MNPHAISRLAKKDNLIRLDRPVIRYTGRGTQHYSHTEAANEEAAFWQSKATRNGKAAPLPQLVSLPQLARDIRRTWP